MGSSARKYEKLMKNEHWNFRKIIAVHLPFPEGNLKGTMGVYKLLHASLRCTHLAGTSDDGKENCRKLFKGFRKHYLIHTSQVSGNVNQLQLTAVKIKKKRRPFL